MTVTHILSAPTGRCGYAVIKKWWNRRISPAFCYSQIKLELTVCLTTYKHAWRRSQVGYLLWMWRAKRSLCCLDDICWILALQACLQAVVAFCVLLVAYFTHAYSDRVLTWMSLAAFDPPPFAVEAPATRLCVSFPWNRLARKWCCTLLSTAFR